MNLKKPQRNKSTGTRVCVLIPTTTAITSAPAITTTSIAAAVIPGMAVTVEPAIAAGIRAGRAVVARSAALIFTALISHHDPANKKGAGDDDARQ